MDIVIVNTSRSHNYIGEYIGRPSILGNPYNTAVGRKEAISAFSNYLNRKIQEKDPVIIGELERLYSIAKNEQLVLICWCAPKSCHGEVIKNILETHHETNLW